MSMQRPGSEVISLINEINHLWRPVFPYLARHISEVYGREGGRIAEIGPFCGAIYELTGDALYLMPFPGMMTPHYVREVEERGLSRLIEVKGTDPYLGGVHPSTIDLIIFRGGVFFPDFFAVDFRAIMAALSPGGTALVGGGFGKYTPPGIIAPIARRSRELNIMLGKVEMDENRIHNDLVSAGISDHAEITTDGGLWIALRKPAAGLDESTAC